MADSECKYFLTWVASQFGVKFFNLYMCVWRPTDTLHPLSTVSDWTGNPFCPE